MAKATFVDSRNLKLKSINQTNYSKLSIEQKEKNKVTINEVLPFRIRFTNIGILGNSVLIPGIGLQIIGVNNYIL